MGCADGYRGRDRFRGGGSGFGCLLKPRPPCFFGLRKSKLQTKIRWLFGSSHVCLFFC